MVKHVDYTPAEDADSPQNIRGWVQTHFISANGLVKDSSPEILANCLGPRMFTQTLDEKKTRIGIPS